MSEKWQDRIAVTAVLGLVAIGSYFVLWGIWEIAVFAFNGLSTMLGGN